VGFCLKLYWDHTISKRKGKDHPAEFFQGELKILRMLIGENLSKRIINVPEKPSLFCWKIKKLKSL